MNQNLGMKQFSDTEHLIKTNNHYQSSSFFEMFDKAENYLKESDKKSIEERVMQVDSRILLKSHAFKMSLDHVCKSLIICN